MTKDESTPIARLCQEARPCSRTLETERRDPGRNSLLPLPYRAAGCRPTPLHTSTCSSNSKHSTAVATLPTPLTREQLIFPERSGQLLNLHDWRKHEWKDALEAAGLAYRGPNQVRHTFATLALAANVPIATSGFWAATQPLQSKMDGKWTESRENDNGP